MVYLSSIHLKTYGIFVGISVFSSALGRCSWSAQCPCGTSNTSFSFCLDVAPQFGDACARWENCATCRRDSDECYSCPEGRSGSLCDQTDSLGTEVTTSDFPRKRQRQNETASTNSIYSKRVRKRSTAFMLSCPDPGEVSHATASEFYAKKRGFFPGEKLGYVCHPGYDLVGEAVLRCLNNSQWSAEVPECHYLHTVFIETGTSCSDPGEVANADVIKRPLEAMFACHSGYVRFGASVLRCVAPGRWDGELPRCVRPRRRPGVVEPSARTDTLGLSECLDPGQVENADRYTDGFPENTSFYTITYTCASGYTAVGSSVIKCLGNDSWSSERPTCERVALNQEASVTIPTTSNEKDSADDEYDYDDDDDPVTYCPSPGTIENGNWTVLSSFNDHGAVPPRATDNAFPERTRLKFSCDEEYSMVGGFPTIYCQHRGIWSGETPFCNMDCGYSTLHTLKRVYRGVKTEPGEWPWTVAISKISGNYSKLSCGGSLLDTRTVLTAAHCLMDPDLEDTADVRLYFGKYNRSDARDDDQVVTRTPSIFMVHPKYDAETKDNDIALIRFEPPVRYSKRIRPVCLPTRETTQQNLQTNKSGYVVGWGTTEKNLMSEELLMALVPVVLGPECKQELDEHNISMLITRNMFCAGYPEGRVASCTGDSGGPLVFHDPDTDRHTIEGIVSFGRHRECGMEHRYTVYTLVSRYLRWINESMTASDQNEVTPFCQGPGPLAYGEWSVASGQWRTVSLTNADDEFPPATTLEFTCHDGFKMEGSKTLRCLSSGFWSGGVPACQASCVWMKILTVPIWDPFPCEPPWLVGMKVFQDTKVPLLCAGTLLDSTTVLTSADCLWRDNVPLAKTIPLYFVNISRIGAHDDDAVLTRTSSEIIPHYQYNSTTEENNIGIIRFSPPIELSRRIRPIDLPTKLTSERNLKPGKRALALGSWQATWFMHHVDLQVISPAECDAKRPMINDKRPLVRDKMFCATIPRFNGVMYLSLGGFLVSHDAVTHKSILEGVLSFTDMSSPPYTFVYTKVSRYIKWIEGHMGP